LFFALVEVPERLTVSYEALVRSGLADHCVSIPVREATEEEILLIHSEEYLEKVKKTPHMSVQELKDFALQFNAVYFHPNSYHCAKLAVGAALQLVDHVLMGKVRNGMALVRPPGHHSMRDAACGFCTFNNVAIAAQYAKQKYGLKRVLIVDWDIHHGQGVQYCFEDDPSVLYFSWHRYEHSIFWPHLPESDYDAVGKDKGVGFNINVPWNKVGMTNSDFLSVFCHVLLPVAYEFCPELVLVSAGYDSGIGDPEGEMCATPDIFAHLTHLLMNLAGGKVCAVLEGGYNLTSLSQSVCQTVQTLLGDPNPRPENLRSPCQSALESIHCVRWAHRRYWSCSLTLNLLRMSCSQCCILSHLCLSPRSVLVVCVGDGEAPIFLILKNICLHAGKTVVFVPQGCADVSGVIQAVFGLLLPLGYEFDPSLVLLVRMPGSEVSDGVWQQLTGLLQCLAQGHVLVLIQVKRLNLASCSSCSSAYSQLVICVLLSFRFDFQECEKSCVSPTACSLLGEPAPPLGQLQAPLPQDVEDMERLRRKLLADWTLLQTTGEHTASGSIPATSINIESID
uniref:Histone deacetylase domain-containing protein n=1 Tax=Salarias fasciatus TaxID=181472 RepID=A0A672HGP8_SALFA